MAVNDSAVDGDLHVCVAWGHAVAAQDNQGLARSTAELRSTHGDAYDRGILDGASDAYGLHRCRIGTSSGGCDIGVAKDDDAVDIPVPTSQFDRARYVGPAGCLRQRIDRREQVRIRGGPLANRARRSGCEDHADSREARERPDDGPGPRPSRVEACGCPIACRHARRDVEHESRQSGLDDDHGTRDRERDDGYARHLHERQTRRARATRGHPGMRALKRVAP